MRIAINCRSFLKKHTTGIGRYSYNLVRALLSLDQENDYSLYVRRKIFDPNRETPKFEGRNVALKRDYFNLGPERVLKDIDVYHSPCPEFIRMKEAKIVITIHDLIYKTYPEGHTQDTIEYAQKQMEDAINHADKIICCSKSTEDDLKKHFNVESDKTCAIHHGVNHTIFYPLNGDELRANEVVRLKGIESEYIFFVGTIEPRKNLKNILKSFAQLKPGFKGKLVIAGMKGWKSENLEKLLTDLNIKNDVIFLGFLTNEELRFFYAQAAVFVFPSLYEGFGFPILEAFSCGAPVVTSNVSSCPELAGDAALQVDPNNVEELTRSIQNILEDKQLRQSLIEKGKRRAAEFTFEKTARETLEIYKEVCSAVTV